ncbi:MAG: serine/threonine-protein kinase [Gloeomargarita sp. SKYBB_i_bin120]|nr:serine/threonine-protein kinase [Gloeomargarita sp. SKYG98]MCS7292607.1 serine/threonine-protein kinase [Gloeomargarita sp. SKYB120]MDW8178168.1 serine/threonine-protein kinase [Gloeomargarita sp. SKYBB_i_bin120]
MKKCLGYGGFGATFLAVEENLPGRPLCVIKQLRPPVDNANDPIYQMAKELFEREAEILGRLGNHPQLASLRDYFTEAPYFYMVQEFIDGQTLQAEVREKGPYEEGAVKLFLRQILPVLQYIHQQGVIHRDIKPANIIRRKADGALILIDFGAVKQVGQIPTDAENELTQFAIGTAGYAPPEQLSMRPVYASDIYALGCTCLYLLTGKSPKELETDPQTGEIRWRQHVRVSDAFAQVLDRMLAISLKQRYATANAVLRALDLEPYYDTLAQGRRAAATPPPSPALPEPLSDPESHLSRLAAAIRARKARATPIETGGAESTRLSPAQFKQALRQGRKDFAGYDLRGYDLQGQVMVGCILTGAILANANLRECILEEANLGRANLQGANLQRANMHKAYLSFANLQGADLRNADLTEAYLRNANLRDANLCGANLEGALVAEEQLAMARTNWATKLPVGMRRGTWWPL